MSALGWVKLDAGEYDAIILATSGLERLGLHKRIRRELDDELSLPAVGQGHLPSSAAAMMKQLSCCYLHLITPKTRLCVLAERAMNRAP